MAAHEVGRSQRRWLAVRELEQRGAAGGAGGAYARHSQPIQALAQKLDANLATATELRKQKPRKAPSRRRIPITPSSTRR
jgi:hypothetical protein